MNHRLSISTLFVLVFLWGTQIHAQELPDGYPVTDRSKECINTGWKFHLGDPEQDFFKKDLDDSGWTTINVPHTLELTDMSLNGHMDDKTQETFQRDVGWYRRDIKIDANKGQKVYLEFEGVHQVTDLWVNGKHVGQHAVGGYTPFHFDITDYVEFGGNTQVTVLADNRRRDDVPPDPGPFDYIKFSGLYRDVYLVQKNPLHITFNWEALEAGVFVTTPSVDPINMNATIQVRTAVKNEGKERARAQMLTRIIDDRGIVVLRMIDETEIDPGRSHVFNQVGGIENDLRLWSPEDPYLYRVNSLVMLDGKEIDFVENPLGIRKLELDHDGGFVLNGEPIKLIGTNRHQHYGYIGDAMPNSLHYKDVLQIKQLGMNVIRTAHYPHDDALIEACDELGLLVYEEAPTWIDIENDAWFDNFEKALRTTIRNHRNHPSVIIWGAGINHRGYVPRAQFAAKQEDPTRFTASQSSRWTGWQTSGLTDIYAQMVYGEYYWNDEEHVLAMEGGWNPAAVNEVMDHPKKLGLILWTAHAYYTFHDFHGQEKPEDRSRLGIMDIFRYPKPGLMWYKSELVDEPFLHIRNDWKAGQDSMTVYSNAEEIQLLLDGKELGQYKPSGKKEYSHLNHPPFHVPIGNFETGELTVKGLIGGEETASQSTRTAGKAYALKLELDMDGRVLSADGSDIAVAYASIVDKQGTLVRDGSTDVKFSVKGPAHVVGTEEGIGSNPKSSKKGIAPALIQAGTEAGEITVKASARGLKPAEVKISSIPAQNDMIQANAAPIYDFEKVLVDIGEYKQLLQYDWIPWNGSDNSSSVLQFDKLGGFTARLQASEQEKLLRWLGEINVMGKHAYAFGEGVLCMDTEGLVLTFEGLKKGKYKIITYHHAPRSGTDSMDPNQELQVTATIFKLPYAEKLDILLEDAAGTKSATANVTFGKEMHTGEFGCCEIIFESDGENPVYLKFTDPKAEKGVWLNAFELMDWL